MVRNALLVLGSLLFVGGTASADCKFTLNVVNKTGKKIKVQDVNYKLHKSSWELLSFGEALDLNNGDNSLRDKHRNLFHVWNAAADCPGQKYRFKLTYNCYEDPAGLQTRHSDILQGSKEAALATQTGATATVNDCSGGVDFED